MSNPIIERELVGVLRTRKALALQVLVAGAFALLVLVRWPSDGRVELSGMQSQQVFRLFGYGLLGVVLLLVPIVPAVSIVREKISGTLALLLNSPMSPLSIYLGKLAGVLGFVLIILVLSLPAAVACYVMGGISLTEDLAVLYGILALVALQFSVVGLFVSTVAGSTESSLRITYGLVLLIAVVTIGPHLFLQGSESTKAVLAEQLRCLSPIPAVMEVLGHSDMGGQGMISTDGIARRYLLFASLMSMTFVLATLGRLNHSIFDRSRSQGIITDERSAGGRAARRLFFLVDPQRRKSGIAPFMNPVMVKEFRCRRFGRFHWILRLVAGCALVSLLLTYAATAGTLDWGVETIGGIMVLLQVSLLVLLTPSLAAGLISAEREHGGWTLLQMTPMSSLRILNGKLFSVIWTVALLLLATLPGYVVMIYIKPSMQEQVHQVLICLLLTAGLAISLSAAIGSFFRQSALATTTAYGVLLALCAGTMLVWMARGAPFGHSTVEAVLAINPMAAALSVIEAPGFAQYQLVPLNWWITGMVSVVCLTMLLGRVWKLTRPQ